MSESPSSQVAVHFAEGCGQLCHLYCKPPESQGEITVLAASASGGYGGMLSSAGFLILIAERIPVCALKVPVSISY